MHGIWRFAGAALLLILAACQAEEDGPPDDGLANYDPHLFETQQASCEARDGTFAQGGITGGYQCFTTPRDAGKSCSKASDCSTQCLARSRTCAPIQPLFGCHDILTSSGAPVTLCID